MTASLDLTPSQAKWMQAHKERKERIAAQAKPDKPILCTSASARSEAFSPPPKTVIQEWTERQLQLHKPFWFVILGETDPPRPPVPSIRTIQRIVARHYDLPLSAMESAHRGGELVKARQVAIFLAKEFTLRSLPEIGRRFGGRDHTTLLHAIKKIKKSEDKELAADLEVLRQQIREAS